MRGRCAGVIRPWGALGEFALVRLVDARRHQLQRPRAWAIAIEALEAAHAAGAAKIVVVDRAERLEWWADLGDFERQGFEIDLGHGPQRALELKWWSHRPMRVEEMAALERPRR